MAQNKLGGGYGNFYFFTSLLIMFPCSENTKFSFQKLFSVASSKSLFFL